MAKNEKPNVEQENPYEYDATRKTAETITVKKRNVLIGAGAIGAVLLGTIATGAIAEEFKHAGKPRNVEQSQNVDGKFADQDMSQQEGKTMSIPPVFVKGDGTFETGDHDGDNDGAGMRGDNKTQGDMDGDKGGVNSPYSSDTTASVPSTNR